jgi:PIN domain nuclease of toxin-antitoxin system
VRLLLDTHIWIWSLLDPAKLSRRVRAELESPDNELWLSPISSWELLVLIEKGRVEVDKESVQWVTEASRAVALREAALTHEVAVESRVVDLPHQDPADRFLAATARVYDLTLVTSDERLLGSRRISTLANR